MNPLLRTSYSLVPRCICIAAHICTRVLGGIFVYMYTEFGYSVLSTAQLEFGYSVYPLCCLPLNLAVYRCMYTCVCTNTNIPPTHVYTNYVHVHRVRVLCLVYRSTRVRVLCLVYSVLSTLSCLLCLVYSVLSTLSCLLCVVYSVLSTLSCLLCVVYSVLSTLSCLLCLVYSVYSVLSTAKLEFGYSGYPLCCLLCVVPELSVLCVVTAKHVVYRCMYTCVCIYILSHMYAYVCIHTCVF